MHACSDIISRGPRLRKSARALRCDLCVAILQRAGNTNDPAERSLCAQRYCDYAHTAGICASTSTLLESMKHTQRNTAPVRRAVTPPPPPPGTDRAPPPTRCPFPAASQKALAYASFGHELPARTSSCSSVTRGWWQGFPMPERAVQRMVAAVKRSHKAAHIEPRVASSVFETNFAQFRCRIDRNTNSHTNTKYSGTCDTGQTRNKL